MVDPLKKYFMINNHNLEQHIATYLNNDGWKNNVPVQDHDVIQQILDDPVKFKAIVKLIHSYVI